MRQTFTQLVWLFILSLVPMASRGIVNPNLEIWGNIIWDANYAYDYGLYSFTPTTPVQPVPKMKDFDIHAAGGAAYFDNMMHLVDYSNYSISYFEFDLNTGKKIKSVDLQDYSLIAQSGIAFNPVDGKYYGIFLNAEGSAYELGCIDYSH